MAISRQNLATFCSTYLDSEVHQLMDASLDKNMIDKDEYPATAELEKRCVHILADLWNAPKNVNATGCSTTGSSEACMLGGLALKHKMARTNEKPPANQPTSRTSSWLRCKYVGTSSPATSDVELREIPLEHGRLGMTPEEVLKRVDENTIGVVPTFGVTFMRASTNRLQRSRKLWTVWRATSISIFRSMWMLPAVFVALPSAELNLDLGISGFPVSARSTAPAINTD